jgi:FkbM family methyltransferase
MQTIRDKLINLYFRQDFINKGKNWVANHIIRRYIQQITCKSRNGHWYDIDPRDIVQLSILTKGEWEPEETRIIINNLYPGQVFYDIGANFGYYSILASSLVGESGQVYAFEPNPYILKKLERNLNINHIQNVTVFPYAVSDHQGERKIYLGPSKNSGATSFRHMENCDQEISVKTINLDEFVNENHLHFPDFIKLDIEGAEFLAMIGMADVISNSQNVKVLIEVSDFFLRQVAGNEALLLEKAQQYGLTSHHETSSHNRIMDDGKPLQYMLFLTQEPEE